VTGSPIRRPRKQGGKKGWAEKDAPVEREDKGENVQQCTKGRGQRGLEIEMRKKRSIIQRESEGQRSTFGKKI
jgi:hypothetical protein